MEYTFSLIPHNNIQVIIPFLKMLDLKADDEILKGRLSEMVTQGYECVGVYDGDKLIGISGLWILTKYYIGKHIEPDNVVILPEYRSKGVGDLLMNWIFEYGKSKGCVASELNCYVTNSKGHKFWFEQGYKILGFHFQKKFQKE